MQRSASFELKMMVKALSLHPWLNSPEEAARLIAAKAELASRAAARRELSRRSK